VVASSVHQCAELQEFKGDMRISLSRRSPFGLSETTILAEDRNRRTQARYLACLVAAVSSLISGCVTVGVEGANITKDKLVYQANIEAARWLCLSSRQGHGPAMLKVGRILSGDVVDGFRVARRVAHGVMGATTNLPVAYGWLCTVERNGVPEAKDRADALWAEMSHQERMASKEHQIPFPNACTCEEAGLKKTSTS